MLESQPEAQHETERGFCRTSGTPWLDLSPTLKGRSAADLWLHPLDAHPGALAHRLTAMELAPTVRRRMEGG